MQATPSPPPIISNSNNSHIVGVDTNGSLTDKHMILVDFKVSVAVVYLNLQMIPRWL